MGGVCGGVGGVCVGCLCVWGGVGCGQVCVVVWVGWGVLCG